MKKLADELVYLLVDEYSPSALLERLADPRSANPFWPSILTSVPPFSCCYPILRDRRDDEIIPSS